MNGGSLDLIFESKFDTSFIKGESSVIQEAVKDITGKAMAIKVRQKIAEKEEAKTEKIVDERIDIVKAAFRGEIIRTGE